MLLWSACQVRQFIYAWCYNKFCGICCTEKRLRTSRESSPVLDSDQEEENDALKDQDDDFTPTPAQKGEQEVKHFFITALITIFLHSHAFRFPEKHGRYICC